MYVINNEWVISVNKKTNENNSLSQTRPIRIELKRPVLVI